MTEKVEIKKEESKDKKAKDIIPRADRSPSFFHHVDKLFDEFRNDFVSNWLIPRSPSRLLNLTEDFFRNPLTNVVENDVEYIIEAEMPGIKKENVNVTLKENKLEITAEQKQEKSEEKKGEYLRREYQSSNFYRSFIVPENVIQSDIDAKFEKGVLTINLPKTKIKEKDTKKIEIK